MLHGDKIFIEAGNSKSSNMININRENNEC